MKIGVDVRVLLDKQYSGVASFTFYLLKNLLQTDKHNAYSFFYNSFKKSSIPEFISGDKIISTKYPNKVFNYLLQKRLNYPKLDKIIGGVDIFYSPHINFSSLSSKSKNVITIHDLSFLRYPEFFSRRKNFWHRSLNLAKNIKQYDKIIAVSNNTKRDLIDLLNVPDNKIEVIHSGLDDLIFNDNIEIPNNIREIIDKNYILYLGTIEPRKNISGIISAYNKLRDSGDSRPLVLAGAWGWKTAEIKKKWQESKYKNDIKFLGYVDNKFKPLLYKKASVFVYPSFYEGFGFPPLEAMYFGLPVISSNTSSLPEILGDNAILVNPDKSYEIFQAMKTIENDNDLRNILSEKGRDWARKFTWDKTAQKYLDVFNNLTS